MVYFEQHASIQKKLSNQQSIAETMIDSMWFNHVKSTYEFAIENKQ